MIKNSKYKAFTLVEMLIVMGILSVLMAIGVSVARFAIQRANNIQHQNAVDQLFQAFQSYYTDNRRYPKWDALIPAHDIETIEEALEGGVLDQYVDANFDGGSPAMFYYLYTNTNAPQGFLVCVSFADKDANSSSENSGGYCNGNGFGATDLASSGLLGKSIERKTFEAGDATNDSDPRNYTWGDIVDQLNDAEVRSYWNGRGWEGK